MKKEKRRVARTKRCNCGQPLSKERWEELTSSFHFKGKQSYERYLAHYYGDKHPNYFGTDRTEMISRKRRLEIESYDLDLRQDKEQ